MSYKEFILYSNDDEKSKELLELIKKKEYNNYMVDFSEYITLDDKIVIHGGGDGMYNVNIIFDSAKIDIDPSLFKIYRFMSEFHSFDYSNFSKMTSNDKFEFKNKLFHDLNRRVSKISENEKLYKQVLVKYSGFNNVFKVNSEYSNTNKLQSTINKYVLNYDEHCTSIYNASVKAMSKEYNIVESSNNSNAVITDEKNITINSNLSTEQKIKELYIEVARREFENLEGSKELSNSQKNLESESTSFLLSSKYEIKYDNSIKNLKEFHSEGGNISNVFNRVYQVRDTIVTKFENDIIENIKNEVEKLQVKNVDEVYTRTSCKDLMIWIV